MRAILQKLFMILIQGLCPDITLLEILPHRLQQEPQKSHLRADVSAFGGQ